MIPLQQSNQRHSALYDTEGNIILPSEPSVMSEQCTPANSLEKTPPLVVQTQNKDRALMEERKPIIHSSVPRLNSLFHSLPKRTSQQVNHLTTEGVQQYRFSAKEFLSVWMAFRRFLQSATKRCWVFLVQPVWVVRPRKEPKRYSRISLFIIDTVRFGGTFAALFAALFVTLNYQSFWQIILTRLDPLQEIQAETGAGVSGTTAALRDKLLKSPMLTTAGSQEGGNLLGFLPPVGPPENRLIIPKLNLNVPIVIPPYEALLREDWTQVESDIQRSLEQGIVHYPGTAKPGQPGNFFMTGHSSYYPWAPGEYKTVFARLHMLSEGDEYWVYYGGDKHRYSIRSISEVKPSNVDVLDQPADRRLSTLMTCTPVGTTLRRLIVSAEEVDPETGEPLAVGQQPVRERPRYKMEMLPI